MIPGPCQCGVERQLWSVPKEQQAKGAGAPSVHSGLLEALRQMRAIDECARARGSGASVRGVNGCPVMAPRQERFWLAPPCIIAILYLC